MSRPAFNHTRWDSPLTPCDECHRLMRQIADGDDEAERDILRARVAELEERQAKHLELIADLSRELPSGETVQALDEFRSRVRALVAEVGTLRSALTEACDLVEEWGQHADRYFRDKWDLAGEVSRLRALARSTR